MDTNLFFGACSDGAEEAVAYEMHAAQVVIVAGHKPSCALIIRFDKFPSAIGTLDVIFQLFEDPRTYRFQEEAFTFDTVACGIKEIVHGESGQLRSKLLGCDSWRVSGIRKDFAGLRQNFRSKDLELLFTDAVRSAFGAAPGDTLLQHGLPPVDLLEFDLEFFVWVRGGALAVGWLDKETSRIIQPPTRILISKGDTGFILSKSADTTAFVMACIALKVYEAGGGCLQDKSDLICGDPMCGVGTCLFALQYFVSTHLQGVDADFIGSDTSEPSIAQARANLARLHLDGGSFTFAHCAAEDVGRAGAMPLNGVDLVLVDPPWGHRHGNFADIARRTPAWARQWVAILR